MKSKKFWEVRKKATPKYKKIKSASLFLLLSPVAKSFSGSPWFFFSKGFKCLEFNSLFFRFLATFALFGVMFLKDHYILHSLFPFLPFNGFFSSINKLVWFTDKIQGFWIFCISGHCTQRYAKQWLLFFLLRMKCNLIVCGIYVIGTNHLLVPWCHENYEIFNRNESLTKANFGAQHNTANSNRTCCCKSSHAVCCESDQQQPDLPLFPSTELEWAKSEQKKKLKMD